MKLIKHNKGRQYTHKKPLRRTCRSKQKTHATNSKKRRKGGSVSTRVINSPTENLYKLGNDAEMFGISQVTDVNGKGRLVSNLDKLGKGPAMFEKSEVTDDKGNMFTFQLVPYEQIDDRMQYTHSVKSPKPTDRKTRGGQLFEFSVAQGGNNSIIKLGINNTKCTKWWFVKFWKENDQEVKIYKTLEESILSLSPDIKIPDFHFISADRLCKSNDESNSCPHLLLTALNECIKDKKIKRLIPPSSGYLCMQDMTEEGYIILQQQPVTAEEYKQICKNVGQFVDTTKVFHNDLKPDNILVNQQDPTKICMFDFDISIHIEKSEDWGNYHFDSYWEANKGYMYEQYSSDTSTWNPETKNKYAKVFDLNRLMCASQQFYSHMHTIPSQFSLKGTNGLICETPCKLIPQYIFYNNGCEDMTYEWYTNFYKKVLITLRSSSDSSSIHSPSSTNIHSPSSINRSSGIQGDGGTPYHTPAQARDTPFYTPDQQSSGRRLKIKKSRRRRQRRQTRCR